MGCGTLVDREGGRVWNPIWNRDQGLTLESASTQPARPTYPPTAPPHTRQPMEDAERDKKGEKESPPLQIDPKWHARQIMLSHPGH